MDKAKDTIYIDVDEEITGIVGKVGNSPKKIVALVLPKRANTLQSIVNMKLLKRTADQTDKQVVLITSEPRLFPLAGAAGVHVAPNLTTKPYLPPVPGAGSPGENQADSEVDINTPVSQVAPDAKFADDQDSIEIDNTAKPEALKDSPAKPKSNKKFKIPNFSKFRKRMIFGGLAILLLIFGLVYGLVIAPKATVTFKAETTDVPITMSFTADPGATELDKDKNIVRALKKESEKTDSEKVSATGEENKGDKATGNVTMTAKKCSGNVLAPPSSVPAGTGISASDLTYITQKAVAFTISGASFDSSTGCYTYPGTNSTIITSQESGKKFNLSSATNFSVAGRSDVSASGNAEGGTDDIVKVVSLADIKKAKERLNGKQNSAQDELKAEFGKEGYLAIDETYKANDPDYTQSAAVGAEADEVSVTAKTKYSMLGINQDDIKELIKQEVAKKQEGGAQVILSDGLNEATFRPTSVSNVLSKGQTAFNIDTKVITGPDINQDEIKQQVSGKKSGEAENLLKQRPGITDPSVKLEPSWVGTIPKPSKITVEIQQADGSNIPQN